VTPALLRERDYLCHLQSPSQQFSTAEMVKAYAAAAQRSYRRLFDRAGRTDEPGIHGRRGARISGGRRERDGGQSNIPLEAPMKVTRRKPACALSASTPPFPGFGRVEVWRGDFRSSISVAASFVWRCLSGSTMAPFPHPAHRTGHADFPHPALGQDVTPSPTTGHAQARSGVRARSARKGVGVDRSRPCVA
jgi:hypothetical protein